MTRRLRWGMPNEPAPKRPYRDSIILYAVLAVVIVVVAWVTGGGIGRAVAFAIVFFVLATAWSVWRWRERLRADAARAEREEDVLR